MAHDAFGLCALRRQNPARIVYREVLTVAVPASHRARRVKKNGSECTFRACLRFPWPADLPRPRRTPDLGFDGLAEAARAVGMLPLDLSAYCIQLVRRA